MSIQLSSLCPKIFSQYGLGRWKCDINIIILHSSTGVKLEGSSWALGLSSV
jgi:hypothetical protein